MQFRPSKPDDPPKIDKAVSALTYACNTAVAGVTRVASVQIYDHVEAMEYMDAHRLSAVMLVFSFLVLLALYAWRPRPVRGA